MIDPNLESLQKNIHETIQYQGTCKTCFMNGKSCANQSAIERAHLAGRNKTESGKIKKAFFLMPFRTLFDQVYQTQFHPHLEFSCEVVERADDVTMTGFVVCERICRQIQESFLIAADLTFDNPNVFYELGLAYALNKNIAVFVQKDYEKDRNLTLTKLHISTADCNFYTPFSELKTAETRIWNVSKPISTKSSAAGNLRDPVVILLGDPTTLDEPFEIAGRGPQEGRGMISYQTNHVCAGAIHKALSVVERELGCEGRSDRVTIHIGARGDQTPYAGGIRTGEGIKEIHIQSAAEIEDYIRHAKCVIICASPMEPATFFWMGFAHGLEKAVVPITVQPVRREVGPGTTQTGDGQAVTPLPFDVAALWHIYVTREHIDKLQEQMAEIYKIVLQKDKDTIQRREFWKQTTGTGSVSIFIGSVQFIAANKRHVVGEWDYRTVSEVIGYLNSTNQNMEIVIQTPIFQTSQRFRDEPGLKGKELTRLEDMLAENQRNAIIVGTADVNDMTDYVLARYAEVEYFEPAIRTQPGFCGIVAFKHEGDYTTWKTPSVYFARLPQSGTQSRDRGFYDVNNAEAIGSNPNNTYASSMGLDPQRGYASLYSHVAKFNLGEQSIIVVQGISGPATFGLAQLLTGAKFRQFTDFGTGDPKVKTIERLKTLAANERDEFLQEFYKSGDNQARIPDIEKYSEQMVARLNEEFRQQGSVEAIVRVFVSDPFAGEGAGAEREDVHDERRVLWWHYALTPRKISRPKQPLRLPHDRSSD